MTDDVPAGRLLGYARVSSGTQKLDAQTDVLAEAGVPAALIFTDKLTGTSTREQRPGLSALLDATQAGDVIVVVGTDRLGRDAAEVMVTVRDLLRRSVVIRSLREGIDSSTAMGKAVMGMLASFAELELELGRERRAAAKAARRARGLPMGRPRALTAQTAALAQRMRASGEPVPVIAAACGVSVPTIYRALAAGAAEGGAAS